MSAPQPETPPRAGAQAAAVSPAVPVAVASPRGLFSASARTRAFIVIGVLVLVLLFLFGGDSWLSILDITLVSAIAALGLNVLSGYAGQISLGLSFFMAIGAYTAAWLGGDPGSVDTHYHIGMGLSFLIWLPAAGIAAALVGALIGPTALRLKGFYLGIVTLALVFIGIYLYKNLPNLTGGQQGRPFPAPAFGSFSFASPDPIFGMQFTLNQLYFLLLVVVLGLSGVFVANVARSRAGRAFQAVRDNETAAAIMGINLFQAKMGAFVLSSFLAGIAGALSASYIGYADPDTWSLLLSIQFVAAILIGGVATVWGSILGAAFVFALPPALATLFPQNTSVTGTLGNNLSTILYGVLIIVFLLFEPLGLIGLLRRLQFAVRRFDERRKGGETSSTRALSESESDSSSDSPFDVERTPLPRQADT